MSNLNETGLSVLWERIQMLVRRPLAGILGKANRMVMTDSEGKLAVHDAIRTNITRQTVFETAASNPEDTFGTGVGDVHFLLVLVGEDGEQLSDMDSIIFEMDGNAERLVRRHYFDDDSMMEDPYVLFGNTRYSGYGVPICKDQADTGEESMIFYKDGLLGICLPDGNAHAIWLGNINACISADGTPEAEGDLVSLGYLKTHMPLVEGYGQQSQRQNLSDSEAKGTGSFAANCGKSNGLYTFAANLGSAVGEYAAAFGLNTSAAGRCSAAFGYLTEAFANNTFAAGDNCKAEGQNAFATGHNTLAHGTDQFTFGRFNVPDEMGTYVEIVGTGQGGNRANGRTLDWSGNEWLAGTLEASGIILRDSDGTPYRIGISGGNLTCTRMTDG